MDGLQQDARHASDFMPRIVGGSGDPDADHWRHVAALSSWGHLFVVETQQTLASRGVKSDRIQRLLECWGESAVLLS